MGKMFIQRSESLPIMHNTVESLYSQPPTGNLSLKLTYTGCSRTSCRFLEMSFSKNRQDAREHPVYSFGPYLNVLTRKKYF